MVSAMQVTPVCGSTVDVSNLNLIVFLSNLQLLGNFMGW